MPGSHIPQPMSAGFVLTWTVLGLLAGAAMVLPASRSLHREHLGTPAAAVSVVATSAACAFVAWRFGPNAAVGPATVLAVVGPPLALVDLVERRLPSSLTLAGFVFGSVALIVIALDRNDPATIAFATLVSITVGACYLALALLSAGGLGAGDVKLAALGGLLLSATGWWSVLLASAVTWLTAMLAAVVVRARQRGAADGTVPLGPFLIAGTLISALDLASWSAFF